MSEADKHCREKCVLCPHCGHDDAIVQLYDDGTSLLWCPECDYEERHGF